MLNKILLVSLLVCWACTAIADTVEVNPDHPNQYVVKKGDTLWDISGRFLQQPWRWPEVWEGNPQIADPNLIYPGDVVTLTFIDGEPVLTVNGPDSGRTVRLSPTVRSYEHDEAIPAIPFDVIRSFLVRPLVVEEDEMLKWPYIVASYDEHLIASDGNKIYVRGLENVSGKKRYAVYRRGDPYIKKSDSDGGEDEVLGYEALYVGDAIIYQGGDPATGVIEEANREILVGDRLREEQTEDVNTDFIPSSPKQDIEGNIISVVDGVTQIGQYQVVVLDIGAKDGVDVGNILGIYQSGAVVDDQVVGEVRRYEKGEKLLKRVKEDKYHENESLLGGVLEEAIDNLALVKYNFDRNFPHISNLHGKSEEIKLPESNAGVLMVIRTFDRLSYGLVMDVTAPIHLNDRVKSM